MSRPGARSWATRSDGVLTSSANVKRGGAFKLAEIEAAYDLFAHQRDGVMKVAIRP